MICADYWKLFNVTANTVVAILRVQTTTTFAETLDKFQKSTLLLLGTRGFTLNFCNEYLD
jgi:hypothetical protein